MIDSCCVYCNGPIDIEAEDDEDDAEQVATCRICSRLQPYEAVNTVQSQPEERPVTRRNYQRRRRRGRSNYNGSDLRADRLALGLTQEQLADEIGVQRNSVALWERGERPIGMPSAIWHTIQHLKHRAGMGCTCATDHDPKCP